MLKDILLILSGLVIAIIFTFIKKKITDQTKEIIEEKFQLKKFLSGMTNILSPAGWAKDIYSIFNFRKLILYTIIIGILMGYMYFKGQQSKPVHFRINYENEMTIPIPKGTKAFYKPKNSTRAYWIREDGSQEVIIVKDIPELAKALKPYGFKLEPIVVAGGSLGESGAGFEGGIGLSWLKYFKWNIDSFLTNRGLYPIGTSYQITHNSGAGIGAGIGYKGDKRVILYYKWRF